MVKRIRRDKKRTKASSIIKDIFNRREAAYIEEHAALAKMLVNADAQEKFEKMKRRARPKNPEVWRKRYVKEKLPEALLQVEQNASRIFLHLRVLARKALPLARECLDGRTNSVFDAQTRLAHAAVRLADIGSKLA